VRMISRIRRELRLIDLMSKLVKLKRRSLCPTQLFDGSEEYTICMSRIQSGQLDLTAGLSARVVSSSDKWLIKLIEIVDSENMPG